MENSPRILIVDDERFHLNVIVELLKDDYKVLVAKSAERALEIAGYEPQPDLILLDVVMPEIDGFAFKERFSRRFPQRDTPFVFLSSLRDPEQLVRGLESGVDDYLIKPIDPSVLKAKVRSLLRRRRRSSDSVFQGDLSLLPFIKVVQFCEQQGLTGDVTFSDGRWKMVIPFKAGALELGSMGDADGVLDRLYGLKEGRFTIRVGAIDFSNLAAGVPPAEDPPAPVLPESARPMGKLSGVRAGKRLFQIQTELAGYPENQIVTVVILDGIAVLKRSIPVKERADRAKLEMMIKQLHQVVEAEVQQKVEDLLKAKNSGTDSESETFYTLFDEGFEAFRNGDFEEAERIWLKARALKPDDSTLGINLNIVRSKIEGSSL